MAGDRDTLRVMPMHVLQLERIASAQVRTLFSYPSNRWALCSETRCAVLAAIRFTVIGGEYVCTGAPAAVRPLRQIYSLLLVHRLKSVLLIRQWCYLLWS